MNSYHTICYVSKVQPDLTDQQLQELFSHSSNNNNNKGIKGILLSTMGNFFQVLEGRKEQISSLYEVIKEDSRHNEIYEVFNKPVSKPVFTNYNSAFNVIKTVDELEQLKTYLDTMPFDSTSEKLSRLLAPFLLMEEL